MASQSLLFNVPLATLQAGPDFRVGRSSDGSYQGSLTFTCRKNDIQQTLILQKLQKGTPLLDVYPKGPAKFNFLYVDSWDAQDQTGGYTKVTIDFVGSASSEDDPAFNPDETRTYSRNMSLQEASIFSHPQLIEDLSASDIDFLRQLQENVCYVAEPYNNTASAATFPYYYSIRMHSSGRIVHTFLDSPEVAEWYNLIVTQQQTTYQTPTSEWTMSASGVGPLNANYLSKLGYIDPTPDGDPYTRTGKKWLLSAVNEEIPILDGINSYSVTWTEGDWSEKLYTQPTA